MLCAETTMRHSKAVPEHRKTAKDFQRFHNSYTISTRAVWDLLPEPKGEGNKLHTAQGDVV